MIVDQNRQIVIDLFKQIMPDQIKQIIIDEIKQIIRYQIKHITIDQIKNMIRDQLTATKMYLMPPQFSFSDILVDDKISDMNISKIRTLL